MRFAKVYYQNVPEHRTPGPRLVTDIKFITRGPVYLELEETNGKRLVVNHNCVRQYTVWDRDVA